MTDDGEYGDLTRDEYIESLLGGIDQKVMALQDEVAALRKENRSLRSGMRWVL